MDLVNRIQGILLRPKLEWDKIKDEPSSISHLFISYVAILTLIPAGAQFFAYGIIGFRKPLRGWITYGIGMGFFRSVLLYVLILASVYVFGVIIHALAPHFSSSQDRMNAMKLAVFSMTPVLIGGVFYIVHPLRGLVYVVGLYGIYLLYLGIKAPLLDTPQDKAVPFLLINVVVGIVLMAIATNILRLIFAIWEVYRSI